MSDNTETIAQTWPAFALKVVYVVLISGFTAYVALTVSMSEVRVTMAALSDQMHELSNRLKDHEVLQFRVTKLELDAEKESTMIRDQIGEHNNKMEKLFLMMQGKVDKR